MNITDSKLSLKEITEDISQGITRLGLACTQEMFMHGQVFSTEDQQLK